MKTIFNLHISKFYTLFIIAAVAALVSFNAYAHTNDYMGFGGFSPFGGYGYGFGGYGMDFGGFNHFGGFGGYGMDFGGAFAGFGHGMDFGGHFGGHHFDAHFAGDFGGFGHGFTAQNAVAHVSSRKIVPIPATASVNTSISYDENGEIHVRPFDDEDLFTEE